MKEGIVINNQKQQSGDNSTQIIAQNITIGIDEKRAREIYDEKYEIAKSQFTQEAIEIANSRVQEFENQLVGKMKKIEGALASFADPSTQMLIIEAQKSAAQSERKSDYELLSELLLQKHLNKNNRETVSGISRAVKIVHEMSSEALLALTVIHVMDTLIPTTGDIKQGIDVLEQIFSKIIESPLPLGSEWIEHAELLGAIRVMPYQAGLPPLAEIFKKKFEGYVCIGVKIKSEKYDQALKLLDSESIPHDIFIENTINPGFARLNIASKKSIDGLCLHRRDYGGYKMVPLSEPQRTALNNIFSLYDVDPNTMEACANNFSDEWNKRTALEGIKNWWPSISVSIKLTKVGVVLAHANTQRCDSGVPDLH